MHRVALLLILLVPAAAAQETTVIPEPREWPSCDTPEPVLFAQAPFGLENLAFDGNGSLFLTAFDAGLYQAFPNGTIRFVARDDRPSATPAGGLDSQNAFMGIDVGPDGALYVAEGLSITAPVAARVLRFPVPGNATFEVYAQGFDGANGLAVTPDGVVYVVHGFRTEVWRITAPSQWTKWTEVPSGNGLVEHPDGRLVFSQVADPAQGVLAINVATGERKTLMAFNAGASVGGAVPLVGSDGALLQKGVDDLVVLADGRIVATGHFRKQFLLGDPATGDVCILLEGARAEPTSARVAKGFGTWDGWVFLTDNSGDIHAVDLRPVAAQPALDAGHDGTTTTERPVPAVGLAAGLLLVAGAWLLRRRAS